MNRISFFSLGAIGLIIMLQFFIQDTNCAPSSNGNNSNSDNNRNNSNRIRKGFLSNLFRRQTGTSGTAPTTTESSNDSESDDAQTQTEIDAQKFMDSLPNAGANNGPTTLRERVSDTFGLLRDGFGNQFRSLRENWSDTVEDLRDTWSNSE